MGFVQKHHCISCDWCLFKTKSSIKVTKYLRFLLKSHLGLMPVTSFDIVTYGFSSPKPYPLGNGSALLHFLAQNSLDFKAFVGQHFEKQVAHSSRWQQKNVQPVQCMSYLFSFKGNYNSLTLA